MILAALQHDIGMAAWDAEPVLYPTTGLPYTFTSMPRAMHVELWSQAAGLVVAQSAYAALLVSMHGTGLYQRYVSEQERSQEPARSYLEAELAFQHDLAGRLGADAGELRRNAALLACWDWMSLFACTASSDRTTVEGVPEAAGGRLQLAARPRRRTDRNRAVAVRRAGAVAVGRGPAAVGQLPRPGGAARRAGGGAARAREPDGNSLTDSPMRRDTGPLRQST